MTSRQFWHWFLAHEREIWAIESRDDALMDEISDTLSSYGQGLGFEVSDEDHGTRELIISAMSDATLFEKVDALVADAPALRRWKFTALQPPRGFAFVFDQSGVHLEPTTMAFSPLRSETRPDALGLRVYVPISNSRRRSKQLCATLSRLVLANERLPESNTLTLRH
jgi:hypothetical protein